MNAFETDRQILRAAKGDMDALEQLYLAYRLPVYYCALRLCGGEVLAEDVTQDTFLALWRGAGEYRQQGQGRAWILRIAQNKAMDALRRQSRDLPLEAAPEQEAPLPPEPELLQELLQGLGPKERDIVSLRVLSGFTLTECASMLRLPKGSVFWSYHNAMKKLREKYAKEGMVFDEKECQTDLAG